jgi:hypothetical protein
MLLTHAESLLGGLTQNFTIAGACSHHLSPSSITPLTFIPVGLYFWHLRLSVGSNYFIPPSPRLEGRERESSEYVRNGGLTCVIPSDQLNASRSPILRSKQLVTSLTDPGDMDVVIVCIPQHTLFLVLVPFRWAFALGWARCFMWMCGIATRNVRTTSLTVGVPSCWDMAE